MFRALIWGIVLGVPIAACPDSITVGGDTYRDVYVRSDANHYYIHFPEEGRMERVSKRRTDVRNVRIDSDEERREALLEAYQSNKNKPATPAPETRPASPSTSSGVLTVEAYKLREQRRATALFDAQFNFWKSLVPEQRTAIEQNLAALADGVNRGYSQALGALSGQIDALEAKRSEHEDRLGELELQRNTLAGLSRAGSNADYYRGKARDYRSGSQTELGQRIGEAYDEAARLEEEQANNRRTRIQQEFSRQASPHVNAIGSIDSSIATQKRQGIAVENTARENARRIGGYQALAAQLSRAIEQDYTPRTRPIVVREERGNASQRTSTFDIRGPFWRLECALEDLSYQGEFSVTVYNAETKLPFTRIPSADMLHMRIQMLDGPGEFYLEVSTDDSNVPYSIVVSDFPE